ncbi:hypothetical protein GCM10028832_39900 [Streptomyces sparsus]
MNGSLATRLRVKVRPATVAVVGSDGRSVITQEKRDPPLPAFHRIRPLARPRPAADDPAADDPAADGRCRPRSDADGCGGVAVSVGRRLLVVGGQPLPETRSTFSAALVSACWKLVLSDVS